MEKMMQQTRIEMKLGMDPRKVILMVPSVNTSIYFTMYISVTCQAVHSSIFLYFQIPSPHNLYK